VKALPFLFKVFSVSIFAFLLQFVFRLEIGQFDAYAYMNMAKTFAGLQEWFPNSPRPPFLSFLLTPVALLRYLDLSNETVFLAMHIVSLGISIAFIVVSYLLFKEVLRREFAALAAILLVGQPGFLVYAFETMSDIPGALLSNIVLLFCLKYWNQNSGKFLILISTFSALSITARYPLIVLPVAIWIACVINSKYLKEENWKNTFFNLFCLGFPILTIFLYLIFHYIFLSPHNGLSIQNIFSGIGPYFWHLDYVEGYTENPISLIIFLKSQMTDPVFYFMICGLFVCLKKKDTKIIIFWTWFSSFLGFHIFVGKHYEFRYLFPVLPTCYFLFAYGFQEIFLFFEKKFESNYKKVLSVAVVLILTMPTISFGKEVISFRGNLYYRSFQSKVSRAAFEFAKNGGNIFWLGPFFTMYQPGKEIIENDPFYKVYHFNQNAISFYTDQITYYLNFDTPYLYSSKIDDGSVFVINPYPKFLYRPNLPERPESMPPLMVGRITRSIFSLSKVYKNQRVFENIQTNDRIKLTHRNGRLILEEMNTNFLSKQFVLWVKILKPTGVSGLPEKTIFYFDKDREKGNLINNKDFDSLKEITLLNLKGSKYHFAGSFAKK
jgi:hypothetical protein